MPPLWRVKLRNLSGEYLLADYEGFSFTRRAGSCGAYALRVVKPESETGRAFYTRMMARFTLDAQVEFWFQWAEYGIEWYKEFEALHRRYEFYVREDGALVFESGGPGYNDLLRRRIIAAASGSAEASKSGAAETVAKEYVDEQCEGGAGSRAITGFTVEADGAHGDTNTLGRSNRNVLEVVQEVAELGGDEFAVVGTGSGTFQFNWYDEQLGTDRSSEVIFALERGNMASPRLAVDRTDEVNAVRVGGKGEGTSRAYVWRTDSTLIDDSSWNRIEDFVNASNESTTAGLNQAGDKRLAEKAPLKKLTFDVLQVPGCLYGKHYFLGDKVTADFLGLSETKHVAQVTVTLSASEPGMPQVELEDV